MVKTTISKYIIAFCVIVWSVLPGTSSVCADNQWKNPDILTFSIIPTEETIQELTIYKPLIDYLSKCTGKKINFYMPASYSSVVEAQVNGWVDVAVHGPFSY
ncbi:MAG TPA: PhnD/SsuA/transferrin family substrate-binding protein, partial [Syntrophales bacterium]|nr:PhnD/SsuA/transferrin family substrate-binding protein [Syntrophales bacterium]